MAIFGGYAAINIRPRAYQLEMLEKSLKGNIIVAMGTGSGKTQMRVRFCAVLRVAAELEVCSGYKIIWFLAPTVSLCEQQFDVFSLHLPSVGIKLLLGRDNVDRWSTQKIWDAALSNTRIVVSTPQVLADALSHGFIVMKKLALLIFDEAHHCVRDHPTNKIMKGFYHYRKGEVGASSRPKILGLTASPIVRSKPKELRIIEANMDSITTTPRINRSELSRHVHIPELIEVVYFNTETNLSTTLRLLRRRVEEAETRCDKQKSSLLFREETQGIPKNARIQESWSFAGQRQLKRFCARASHIEQELGSWASRFYITTTIEQVNSSMYSQQNKHLDWKDEERIHIINTLDQVKNAEPLDPGTLQGSIRVSEKFAALLRFLKENHKMSFRGIIFVEQRASAVALCQLLSHHSQTKSTFKCGTFVGTSANQSKKTELVDLLQSKDQKEILKDFREGNLNLIIATSALEEGIDVSECNAVICFSKPPNLKSFIQRRGRARHAESKFLLLLSPDEGVDLGKDWEKLEAEMVKEYMKESRELSKYDFADDLDNDSYVLRVESTGAMLTFKDAVGHLYHFCASLPAYDYVDHRPTFTFQEDELTGHVRALVALPNSVGLSVRHASSLKAWETDDMATKDAAFQAYVALHKAGLLNDNLLPKIPGDGFECEELSENLSSMIEVRQQYDPWRDLGNDRPATNTPHVNAVRIRSASDSVATIMFIHSAHVFSLPWSPLRLEQASNYEISIGDSKELLCSKDANLDLCRAATKLTLEPQNSFTTSLALAAIGDELVAGTRHYSTECSKRPCKSRKLLIKSNLPGVVSVGSSMTIRIHNQDAPKNIKQIEPYLLHDNKSTASKADHPLPKRLLRTRSVVPLNSSMAPEAEVTDSIRCLHTSNQPSDFTKHILFRLESLLVGQELVRRLNLNTMLRKPDIVADALCLPSANGLENNGRLAFLGNMVLDLLVMRKIFVTHIDWHEGYLSAQKKLIVSNAHVSKKAVEAGLDRFIITGFRQQRISEPNKENYDSSPNMDGGTRLLSMKMIANVVKGLIGTAYLQGKLEVSLQCAQTFLPELLAYPASGSLAMACGQPKYVKIPNFNLLEKLIGYNFHNASIMTEAMTHPSCEQDLATRSYGRLALLGSIVLNLIVVESLCCENEAISRTQIDSIQAAAINRGVLAFICIENSLCVEYSDIQQESARSFRETPCQKILPLWSFMRSDHSTIVYERDEFLKKHDEIYKKIRYALFSGMVYPWQALAGLEAHGYFSDIVRSLFGAVYADSNGDLSRCSQLAEKLQILPIVRRLIKDNVETMHPKTRLEEVAGDQNVTYRTDKGPAKLYNSTVQVDGEQVGETQTDTFKQGAEIKAAENAILILRSIPKTFKTGHSTT